MDAELSGVRGIGVDASGNVPVKPMDARWHIQAKASCA